MWFLDHSAESKIFYQVIYAEGKKKKLFDHQRIADSLHLNLNKPIDPNSLPFSRIEYIDSQTIRVRVNNKYLQVNLSDYSIHGIDPKHSNPFQLESLSPDKKYLVFKKNYNLYLKHLESGKIDTLSRKGEELYDYGGIYNWSEKIKEGVTKRPQRLEVSWSPDSKWFRTQVCDYRQAKKLHLIDYSKDDEFRPQLLSYFRALPGDTSLAKVTPIFVKVGEKELSIDTLETQTYLDQSLFWWVSGTPKVLIVDRDRGYKNLHFSLYDLDKRTNQTLFTDSSDTRIGRSIGVQVFEIFEKFTFLSERNGRQQIYSYDLKKNTIANLINHPIIVHRIQYADKENGWLYFIGSRKEEENPYHEYLYRVNIEAEKIELLTPKMGNHAIKFSPKGKYFIDELSSYNRPASFQLHQAETGKLFCELTNTDTSLLHEISWKAPLGFSCLANDRKTEIFGNIWRPSNFDPNKKYPVIDRSYTGPNRNVFPNRFVESFKDAFYDLAEFGFIVISIDGRGTAGRSKKFHNFSYKNLGNGLLDHVTAIKELGRRFNWIDTSRVGICGHSAGGYDAVRAMLMYPDFYKVAVSSSGNHDHRMSNAWWPEMYMGWPVDSSYRYSSNIEIAHKLKGKLLLVHGGLDENINPATTFKLAEAFIREDKEFDMMILPGRGHGYWGYHGAYFRKLRWNYFIENLLGKKPIWDY
ncbi:MAG: prolyl oligopeptidase family serine peptidase [Bacteroidota bacterium]